MHPDAHDEAMGNKFHQKHLQLNGQAMDGVVLFGSVQILQACGHHIGGLPEVVVVLHLVAAVGLAGVVEEFGLDPAGVHGHAADAPTLQLPVQCPAVAEDEGLGSAVGGDIGHRLEGGKTVQLQDVASGGHIGQRQPGHGQQRLAVEIDHLHLVFQRDLLKTAEFSKAGGIDQQLDIGSFGGQQRTISFEAFCLGKIQGNDLQRYRYLTLQGGQSICPAGNDPNFVYLDIAAQLQGKFLTHAGACAAHIQLVQIQEQHTLQTLQVAADFHYQMWGDCNVPAMVVSNNVVSYPSTNKMYMDNYMIKAGVQYTPNPLATKGYYNKIKYRLGCSYSSPYMRIPQGEGAQMHRLEGPSELAVSMGFGLPISNSYNNRSMVNVGFQWLRRSPSSQNLITENYFVLNVGVTFNERWFMKFKIQ